MRSSWRSELPLYLSRLALRTNPELFFQLTIQSRQDRARLKWFPCAITSEDVASLQLDQAYQKAAPIWLP